MIRVLEVNVDDLLTGGVYSLVRNLILHKSKYLQIDIAAIEIFVHKENVRELEEYGTRIHYVGYKGSKWIKQIVCYRHLKALLKREKYDYVHIHADVANKLLVLGIAAKNARTANIVLHSHSSGVDGNHRRVKILFHHMCRRLLKFIGTSFAACSNVAAEWMFPNIKADDIYIIKNGIDLDKFKFCPMLREQVRRELCLTDELLLGHVGQFGYSKNHEYLIATLKQVKKTGIKVKMLLIGEGPNFQTIKDLAKQEGLSEDIIFFGVTKRVNEMLQAMDVFLLPSRFEGLPIVGVEAQAAGLPVIFSDRITKEAILTARAISLPITEDALPRWVSAISEMAMQIRCDGCEELKRKGFAIEETVSTFERLYQVKQ